MNVAQNPIIEEICGFYNYYFQEDVWLDDLSISPKKYLQKLYRNEDYRFLVARPFNWNERIRRQAAVFMIFPNKLFDHFGLFVSGGREAYSHHWENENIRHSLEMVENEPLKKCILMLLLDRLILIQGIFMLRIVQLSSFLIIIKRT